MAARENQGLQIGLIIFVVLTVLLSLTTFVFFRNYQNEQLHAKEASNKESEARTAETNMHNERDQLMQWVGFQPAEKKEAVEEGWKKDMAAFQALRNGTLPDDQKTYRKMIDGLQDIVRSQHSQMEKLAADLRDAKTDFDRKTTEYEAQKKSLADEKKKTVEDYLNARDTNEKLVKELEEKKNELSAKLEQRTKDMEAQRSDLQGKIAERDKQYAQQKRRLDTRVEAVQKLVGQFSVNTVPNGKIVWVNQRDNVVYINLGSDDMLRKRVTFTVYDPNTTDPTATAATIADMHKDVRDLQAKLQLDQSSQPADQQHVTTGHDINVVVSEAKSKGTLEVINVTGPHLAECRILSDVPSNPMLPGDLIYTPLWHAGMQDHFALAGFIDLNGDGESDLNKVLDMIRVNGGIVDVFIDDKGNAVGKLTDDTRYLVKGKEQRPGNIAIPAYSTLVNEAKEMGIEAIELSKFLDLMGYTPPSNVQKDSTGRTVHIPDAGEPSGNFRARTPLDHSQSSSPSPY